MPQGQEKRFPKAKLNPQFDNEKTWFLGKSGLERQIKREIHFDSALRPQLDKLSPDGKFAFSSKWPTSPRNAHGGLLLRESTDGQWVAGIAWDRFLSAQGHNPWRCMHLCVRVGPLKPQESRTIRGRIYLFQGTKEDLLAKYRKDFKK